MVVAAPEVDRSGGAEELTGGGGSATVEGEVRWWFGPGRVSTG